MDKHLHIVTHEVPWPADHGGIFDLFYKIKSLHQVGIKIHLHCFSKFNTPQPILNKYCETVDYYQRKKSHSIFKFGTPFIVQSRNDVSLLRNLNKDNHPVLLEGIHCTFFYKKLYPHRKVFIRLHNAECTYYKHLAKHEKNLLKKIYFHIESMLLYRYEKKIAQKGTFWAVSKDDIDFYINNFGTKQIKYLPVFIPWSTIKSNMVHGNYCLYHGNLSVNENDKAAIWLLKEVFSKINIPFVIAGKNPSITLKKLAHSFTHTCIVENPSEHEMEDLIKKAQINILPSFNKTGVKLKIIHALTIGKHCLVNSPAIKGNDLNQYCHIANDSTQFIKETERLFSISLSEEEIDERKNIVENLFSNIENAKQINSWIY